MNHELTNYAEETRMQLFNIVKTAINNGSKHIQLGDRGCIKVRKNKNGIFYSERNGKGTGVDTGQFLDLIDCVNSVCNSGWYDRNFTKITYK